MSINFRFRSAISSESVDLGCRPAVSVRDLRAMIAAKKRLQVGRHFNIVVVDPDTGTALEEDVEIKAGSSVIIKRVPLERPATSNLDVGKDLGRQNGGYEKKVTLPPQPQLLPSSVMHKVDMENLDDLGVDLYPALHGSLPELPEPYADINNLNSTTKKDVMRRWTKASLPRHQDLQRSEHEAMLKEVVGDNCYEEPYYLEIKPDVKSDVHKKLNEYVPMQAELNMQRSECTCPLCKAIFKEAVMMRCCQCSFCDKCVRLALIEKGMCPNCSVECTINDMLPNLTLRRVVERFLEAQPANNAPHNNIPQYASDAESGIHAKEVFCAVSIRQSEPPAEALNRIAGFQGSNVASTSHQNVLQEEDRRGIIMQPSRHTNFARNCFNCGSPDHLIRDCPAASMRYTMNQTDRRGIIMQPSRHTNFARNCFNCGSPDHLIRDCPAASMRYSMNQTEDGAIVGGMPAYPRASWYGASYAHVGPYANTHGAFDVMPFYQIMVPVIPYDISPYMPSTYPNMPVPLEFIRMRGVQHP